MPFSIYPALITPFTKDNLIDFEALRKLITKLIEERCDGIVVLGTTAEAAALSNGERVMLLHFIRKLVPSSLYLIAGVGSNNIDITLSNIQMAVEAQYDAVLVVTPYYVCPSQKGLEQYYDELAKICPLPILLYNVKRRCGVELESKTIENLLAKHSNIIGLKQAGGNYEQYLEIKKHYPKFKIFSGDDELFYQAMNLGLDGLISVMGNAYLSTMRVCSKDQWVHYCKLIYKEPSPAPIKYILNKDKICQTYVRLPLCEISEELKKELDEMNI